MINDLVLNFDLKPSALGHLTSAVQFGFDLGGQWIAELDIFAIFYGLFSCRNLSCGDENSG